MWIVKHKSKYVDYVFETNVLVCAESITNVHTDNMIVDKPSSKKVKTF